MAPLDYNNTSDMGETLKFVLEEHNCWFYGLLEHLFYPKKFKGDASLLLKTTSFTHWVVGESRDKSIHADIIKRLSSLHDDLFNKAAILLSNAKETLKNPEHKQFKEFLTLFEEFTFYIHRLEQDLYAEGNGFGSFAGLRHESVLKQDLSREMERLSRQGRTFCLALVRIDSFSDLLNVSDKNEIDGYIKLLVGLIKLSIRSFDDAYYMGDGLFALCLKQTEIDGGARGMERLRKGLLEKKVSIPSQSRCLTISCCVTEPVIGDEVAALMEALMDNLERAQEDTDTVLKLRELSALERYARDI